MEKKCAALIAALAEKAARYTVNKASIWGHYQPVEKKNVVDAIRIQEN